MSLKSQPKPGNNTAKLRQDKVLTFFDQSSSNGMTRFYGVVCQQKKQFKIPKTELSADKKKENG